MKKYWINVLILLLITLLLSQLNLAHYIYSIKKLGAGVWVNLILMQLISIGFILVQWIRISKVIGKKVSYKNMLYLVMKGTFYESITPGVKVGGEIARIIILKKEMDFSAGEASALVAIQKSISMLTFVILNIVSLVLIGFKLNINTNTRFLMYSVSIVIISLLILVVFLPEKIYEILEKKTLFANFRKELLSFLLNYKKAINYLKTNRKEIYVQFLLSLCIWILFPIKLYYLVSSININISFLVIFSITFISYIAGMIPIFPGGLGGFEGTMVGLFLLSGISKDYGLIIATIFRFITFWFVVFMSIIYLMTRKGMQYIYG